MTPRTRQMPPPGLSFLLPPNAFAWKDAIESWVDAAGEQSDGDSVEANPKAFSPPKRKREKIPPGEVKQLASTTVEKDRKALGDAEAHMGNDVCAGIWGFFTLRGGIWRYGDPVSPSLITRGADGSCSRNYCGE